MHAYVPRRCRYECADATPAAGPSVLGARLTRVVACVRPYSVGHPDFRLLDGSLRSIRSSVLQQVFPCY